MPDVRALVRERLPQPQRHKSHNRPRGGSRSKARCRFACPAHVNLFWGDENIRHTGGLATPMADGSEVSVLPAVSGGAAAGLPL